MYWEGSVVRFLNLKKQFSARVTTATTHHDSYNLLQPENLYTAHGVPPE